MQTYVEILDKAKDRLLLGWTPEPTTVKSYNLYAGLIGLPGSLSLLQSNISPQISMRVGIKKVITEVLIDDVRTLLGISDTSDFSNTVVYFAITYLNAAGIESTLTDSTVVEALPVGIVPKYRKDDPTVNRFMFGFSEDVWAWVKLMASSGGALITDSCGLYASNTVTEYTYDGTNVKTMKIYYADQTTTGSPAKLTTYEYSGSDVIKVTVTDSTV